MTYPGMVLSRLLKRPLPRALLAVLLLLSVAAAVNVIGLRMVGDITGWSRWLKAHGSWFLCWRLCVYGLTTYCWWRMHARISQREPGSESRLRRVEIAAVLAILTFEAENLIRPS